MARFGGMGGTGLCERNVHDEFENAVDRVMGDQLRSEGDGDGIESPLGPRLWGSLANVSWRHENGDTASYSFRAAGDLIAAVLGKGDYMDWYCSAPDGVIDPEIEVRMIEEGWYPLRDSRPGEAPILDEVCHVLNETKGKNDV